MNGLFTQVLACAIGLVAGTSLAQDAKEPPAVRVVRAERIGGGVERSTGGPMTRQLGPMPDGTFEAKDGEYRSVASRITLRVPRLGDEKLVDVREAVAMLRPDGSPATTHIMFDPDGTRYANKLDDAQSAVIVSRLRDDRPKGADPVLGGLDGGEEQRARLATQGFSYARIETKLGPALQRVVRNRAYTPRFPYDIGLLNDSVTKTYGVTTFVVVGADSVVEFSQLFPCGQRGDPDCRAAALKAHEEFVGGVTDFKMYPATPVPAAR